MKKGSRAAVAVAISATLALGCAGSAWAKDFSDVDYQGGWYVSAVEYVSDKGYMTGYDGSSEFGVGKTLTRGELACLLYKRAGEPSSSKAENLTGMRDIDSPSWYTAAANWAAENKVVTGVDTDSGKQFQPNEPVTREMMATILWRLSGSPDAGSSALEAIDGHDAVDAWALPAMRWAAEAGVLTGVDTASGKDLQAVRAVLREEAAAMIERYDGLSSGGGAVTPAPDPGDNQGGATGPSTPGTGGGSTGGSTEPANPGGGSTGGTTEPANPDPTPTDPAKQDQSAPVFSSLLTTDGKSISFFATEAAPYLWSVDGGSTWKQNGNSSDPSQQIYVWGLEANKQYDILLKKAADATHNESPALEVSFWTRPAKGDAAWRDLGSGAWHVEYPSYGTYFDGSDYLQGLDSVILDRNGQNARNYIGAGTECVFEYPASGDAGTGRFVIRAKAGSTEHTGEVSCPVEFKRANYVYFHTWTCAKCGADLKDDEGNLLATYNCLDKAHYGQDAWYVSNHAFYELNTTLSAKDDVECGSVQGKVYNGMRFVLGSELKCQKCGNADPSKFNGDADATSLTKKGTWTRYIKVNPEGNQL